MLRCNITKQLAIVVFLLILGDSCYPAFLIVQFRYFPYFILEGFYYAKIVDRVIVLP